MRAGLKDGDSGVRYWAATGLLAGGPIALEAARDDLRAALKDPSPSVRAIAAWTLGQHGDAADREQALGALKELAPADANGAYVSILAVNVIDALGTKAVPLHEMLRTMPTKDPKAVGRANGYVDRLVQTVLGEPAKKPAAGAKKAKAAAKKKARKKA